MKKPHKSRTILINAVTGGVVAALGLTGLIQQALTPGMSIAVIVGLNVVNIYLRSITSEPVGYE